MNWELINPGLLLKLRDSSQSFILVSWLLLFYFPSSVIVCFLLVCLLAYFCHVIIWQDIILNESCLKTFFLSILSKFSKHTIYQIAVLFWNFLIKLLSFICIDHRFIIRLFHTLVFKKCLGRNSHLHMLSS